ncbi:hypothetical protein B0T22DRAFT_481612 [Podospora appendiculata]|uniref:Allergen n=1 Tax=Podospora appendiculata TaxID=314037 RepID=A0AAE0XDQ9_9PEZI|nr:hypothetical protein B0T22DRAFT_481612 [Podospora appendiculata]
MAEKAKQVLRDVESKAGLHDTTVHEQVAPSVKHETVKPTKHEEVKTAIDKEVHQDHYHQTVQPVFDKEVLPEQHSHRVAGVERREFDNRDVEGTKRAVAEERGKLRDQRTVNETQHTESRAPVLQGENVHHHIHETIQPVLHKETIQPEVVHTTVPIHEVHHEQAQHHATSTLPPVNLSEYKSQGGVLGGSRERTEAFEGCVEGTHREGCGHNISHKGPVTRSAAGGMSGMSSSSATHQPQGISTETHKKKPSLMDKLNPMTDADGDGKKGFMS